MKESNHSHHGHFRAHESKHHKAGAGEEHHHHHRMHHDNSMGSKAGGASPKGELAKQHADEHHMGGKMRKFAAGKDAAVKYKSSMNPR